jgi:translation initiation factor 4A
MIQEGYMDVSSLKMLAIDEADKMLSRGFKDQVYDIFQFLTEKMQVCLFSATMPTDVLELTQKFMNDPIQILVKKKALILEGIHTGPFNFFRY